MPEFCVGLHCLAGAFASLAGSDGCWRVGVGEGGRRSAARGGAAKGGAAGMDARGVKWGSGVELSNKENLSAFPIILKKAG